MTIDDAKPLFVVEYSISKDEARVRSIDSMLKHNLRDIVRNSLTDYVPIVLFVNRSHAEIFAIRVRAHLEAEVLKSSGNDWQHISQVLEKIVDQLLNTVSSLPRKK